MMRLLKRACALCLALCCLSSCANVAMLPEPEHRTLTLCLEPATGTESGRAAAIFAEMVEVVSDGALYIEVTEDDYALDAMLSSAYDLYLVANDTASQGLGDYIAFSSPYYFDDYYHMSMALNSERFGSLLNARTRSALKVTPMTAFYGGSRVFIHAASVPVASLEELVGRGPATLETRDGILERVLGVRSIDILDIDRVVYNFERRRILLFDFYKRDMDELVYHERVEMAYLMDDFHLVDVNWLMLGADTAESLSEREMAILKEAAAYALAQNDASVLEQESQMLETFRRRFGEASILANGGIAVEFRKAMRESGRYVNLWSWDIYDEIRELKG